jgi:hypothetical protein
MVVTVPSGEVGVLWKRFGGGTVLDPRRLKNEGFNLILPWNQVFLACPTKLIELSRTIPRLFSP